TPRGVSWVWCRPARARPAGARKSIRTLLTPGAPARAVPRGRAGRGAFPPRGGGNAWTTSARLGVRLWRGRLRGRSHRHVVVRGDRLGDPRRPRPALPHLRLGARPAERRPRPGVAALRREPGLGGPARAGRRGAAR